MSNWKHIPRILLGGGGWLTTNQSSSVRSFKVVFIAASPLENGLSSSSPISQVAAEALDEADTEWFCLDDDDVGSVVPVFFSC